MKTSRAGVRLKAVSGSSHGGAEAEVEGLRERFLRHGGAAFSSAEILALVLGSEGKDYALEVAERVLEETAGVAGITSIEARSLQYGNVSEVHAASILAAVELARRMARCQLSPTKLLDKPMAIVRYLYQRYHLPDQEVLGALHLDHRDQLIGECEHFRGAINRASVEPSPVLRAAILSRARGIVLFHTHPGGDASPSEEDIRFTREVAKACGSLGLRLRDHLILAKGRRWVSLERRLKW